MTQALASGMVVADRYRLERLLGEGGMGAVWSATHAVTRKHVALKFLKGQTSANENLVRRFLREARAVSAVNHPNVVAVHDIVQLPDGMPVMVMDLLNGQSLADHLAQVHAMPLDELARVLVPILSAVGTAHAAGIVHRDLKPDNIFLHMRADGELEPKVLDFGIAKLNATEGEAAATAHLTQTGAVLGTPYYMSPEQVFGERDVDQRADVWSLGVILYECLSGRRPIEGEHFGQLFRAITTGSIVPLEQLAPFVPADVTRLVGRMLQVDKKLRPDDLREPYQVLSRYTSKKAVSFAAPALEMAPSSPAEAVSGSADTVAALAPAARQSTAGAFSRTSAAGGPPPKVRRRWLVTVSAVSAVAMAVGAGGWAVLHTRAAPSSSANAASASAPAVQASASQSSSAPPPVLSSSRPAPSASAAASASRKPKPTRDSHRFERRTARKRPAPASGKATPPSQPSAKPKASLPGSVVGNVPF